MVNWVKALFSPRQQAPANRVPPQMLVPKPEIISPVGTGQRASPSPSQRQQKPAPPAYDCLPGRFTVVDVETTGLEDDDRIVSMAVVIIDKATLLTGKAIVRSTHRIFNPEKKSHPVARRLHGLDSWVLQHQPFFREEAADYRELLEDTDLIIAHNAAFDLRFINKELMRAGLTALTKPAFCTMEAYRRRHQRPAKLDIIAAEIGLQRFGKSHDALEDCFLALNVYMWLNDLRERFDYSQIPPELRRFRNMRDVPPKPNTIKAEGVQPKRGRGRPKKGIASNPANSGPTALVQPQ